MVAILARRTTTAITLGAALAAGVETQAVGNGATTLRNCQNMWISAPSTRYRVQIPGYPEMSSEEMDLRMILSVNHQAGPAYGEIVFDDHPAQRDAYKITHVMNWVLEVLRRHEEHWPMRVTIGETVTSTKLIRRLTTYLVRRPGLSIPLPGETVRDAIASNDVIEVSAEGADVTLTAEFVASPRMREAARLARDHC